MRQANKLVLATLSLDKFLEFQSLFSHHPGVTLIPVNEVVRNAEGLSLVETHATYAENALAKARLANQGAHYPTLADDSGIEVSVLGGQPGIHSHRYTRPMAGISQDQANVEKLLQEVSGKPDRSARFVCALVLLIEGITIQSTGILEGTLAPSARGTQGFGYDSIFIPRGSEKTLAEMSLTEKNALSHRAKAVKDLMAQVESHGIIFAKP